MQQGSRVLVGRSVTVIARDPEPSYYTDVHRAWAGKTGRVHAVVDSGERDNPLVKIGFEGGTQIVFYRLRELTVDADADLVNPPKHGVRGSHLP
jgi:hypothetical protein